MAEQQTENGQKKKRAFMAVGAIVAIGLIAGYFYSGYRKTHISTDDAFIEEASTPLQRESAAAS
jgi:multidrug resistance efflux pump